MDIFILTYIIRYKLINEAIFTLYISNDKNALKNHRKYIVKKQSIFPTPLSIFNS